MIKDINSILKRELKSFFITPVAYIYTAIFIVTCMSLTFYFGQYFESGVADLSNFFNYIPWIFMFFIPAVTMKSWSEEKRMGTIELLMTLPIPLWKIVAGKFLATWIFVSLAIILTFPIWITTSYLGDPDNFLIFGTYVGCILMAGGYVSLGIFFSSLTNNQIIAFIISIAASFIFTIAGFPLIINVFSSFLPLELLELISNFSFLSHFTTIQSGYFSLSSFIYFITFILLWNFLTILKLSDNS